MNINSKSNYNLAALIFKISSIITVLVGLSFNIFIVSAFIPRSPIDEITKQWVISSEIKLLVLGFIFILFSIIIHKVAFFRKVFGQTISVEILISLMSLALPITLAELIIRPFTIGHLEKKVTTIFIRDDKLGWKLKPGVKAKWGGEEIEINQKGLRGPELPYEKNKETTRILYLGDSVTFGFRLPSYEVTYPYEVEKLLKTITSRKIETINAGVDGYSPWQYYGFLSDEGIKYNPDLVIVGFFLNDVTEQFELKRFGGVWDGFQLSKSYYSLDDWLKHNVGLYAFIYNMKTKLKFGSDVKQGALNREIIDVGDLALHPDSLKVQKAWSVTLKDLEKITYFCKIEKIPVVIVIFPFRFQFDDPTSLSSPQNMILSFAKKENVLALDLLPLLHDLVVDKSVKLDDLFFDHGHPKILGSEIIAKMIADFLENQNALSGLFPSKKKDN
jgi:hypothetical protein